MEIPKGIKITLEGRNELKIQYTIDNATGHFSYYYLRSNEPMLLFKDGAGIKISGIKCFIEKCYGENNGAEIVGSRKNFSNEEKALPVNNFNSILEAYDIFHDRMIKIPAIGNFPKDANYLDAIQYLDHQGVYQPISNIIIW